MNYFACFSSKSLLYRDPIPEAIGPLKANQKLDENSQVVMSFLNGPESLAVQADFLYAATADGVYQVVFFIFDL